MNLVIFLGIPVIIVLLFIKLNEKRTKKKYGEFLRAVLEGSEKAVPETAGFEIVIAQGAKDALATVKGYDRIQTGYDSLPSLIVRYREDELYIMVVPHPSRTSMEVDQNFILHITSDILKEVNFGEMGKVAFYYKESNKFFAMTVTNYSIPPFMQLIENKKFKTYIKEFASRVNE